MSSFPLPALHLNPPPAQPNPLEQYAQLMQLKQQQQNAPLQTQALQQQVQAGQLENQQRSQALKDQQAMTSAMQQWDGKSLDDLTPLVIKNGASATAVMGLKQKALEMKQQYSTIAKNDAETGASQIATMMKKNDLISGAFSTVLKTPDDQLPQAIMATAQQLSQQGLLDPQHLQMAQQIAQSGNPQQIRTQLDTMRKGMMADSQLLDDAQKTAATQKDTAQASQATAAAAKDTAEMAAGGTTAMADSRYRNVVMAQKLGRPVSPEDAAFKTAYEDQKKIVPVANFNLQNAGVGSQGGAPSALAQSVASGQMKWGDVISPRTPMAVKQQFAAEVKQINPNFNSGDFTVEQKVREDFTSGTDSNSLTAINRAREHMGVFMQTAKDLDNGNVQAFNKLGNAIGAQFGSDKPGNFQIAKQAFSAEVGKAFAGASVAEGDRTELQKSISSASSFQQLAGAARTADSLLAGAQKVLKQKYDQGRQGNPNFGGQNSSPSANNPFAQFGGVPH